MKRPEQVLQKAVVGHLRIRGAPGLVWWHTPSGAYYGSAKQGAIMKSLGARRGVSDLILVLSGKIHCLELKVPGGRASEEQLTFIHDMEKQGAYCAIATGLDQALNTLEAWRLLRPASVGGIVRRLEMAG